MTRRRPAPPAPVPLEAYAAHFDALFSKVNQRHTFRSRSFSWSEPSAV